MNQKTISDAQTEAGQSAPAADVTAMKPKQRVRHLLNTNRRAIEACLPTHLDADRRLRVARPACTSNPRLLECYTPTLLGAVIKAASLGLEVNSALGHGYLVPYKQDVQLIIGYKGYIDLAFRSGKVKSIVANVVREQDQFSYQYGTEEFLHHRPAEHDGGHRTHVYAYAHLATGGTTFEVMSIDDVHAIMRGTPDKGNRGPWKDHFDQMARKTAIRRLTNYLPLSPDMATAAALDGKADAGVTQGFDDVLEGDFELSDEGG